MVKSTILYSGSMLTKITTLNMKINIRKNMKKKLLIIFNKKMICLNLNLEEKPNGVQSANNNIKIIWNT